MLGVCRVLCVMLCTVLFTVQHTNTLPTTEITTQFSTTQQPATNSTQQPITNSTQQPEPNLYPVIGILSQEMRNKMDTQTGSNYTSYLAASYVKYFESGGARVVPIMINQSDEYYRGLLNVINGVVFPGGAAPFRNDTSGYGRAGSLLYDLIREAYEEKGEKIPLFSICLGFEMLLYLDANKINPLTRCKASSVADPLYLKEDWNNTKLIGGAPPDVLNTLTNTNSTSNFHKYCVTPKTFEDLELYKNYTLVSTSYDLNGTEYISTVEHKVLPIYGTQWHPEKNLFEWAYKSIPHNKDAVRAVQYIVNEFVERARHNSPRYGTKDLEEYPLIYNYKPTYIRKIYKSSFQQIYLFD